MTRPLSESLRELADASRSLEPDPAVGERVMAAFDAARAARVAPSRRRGRRWSVLAAAAVFVLASGAVRWVVRRPAPSVVRQPAASEFVPWPGAATLPSFESGELVRVDLPVAVLPSLGLVPPPTRAAAVQADVIVGQDGFARAVRLVE
jgi:hypothetical protein